MKRCLLSLVFAVLALFAVAPALAATPTANQSCSYTVVSGDYLARIAPRFGLSWPKLYSMNQSVIGADPNRLSIGEVLSTCGNASANNATSGQPCQSHTYWPSNGQVSTSSTPPGCYAGDYVPNPKNYPSVNVAFGGCNWWPSALHPTWNIWTLPRHATPIPGVPILFAPFEQGAASEGHWGNVIAISGNGSIALSSEMNSSVNGRGGWGHVVYRYIRVTSGTMFIYPNGWGATGSSTVTTSVDTHVTSSGQSPHAIYHNAYYANAASGDQGGCVWYVLHVRSDLHFPSTAGAGAGPGLLRGAQMYGYATGNVPAVGAIAIFSPGVDGANSLFGHAAMVVAVSGNSFEIAAMAAPSHWMVSYSWHTIKQGVGFIYG